MEEPRSTETADGRGPMPMAPRGVGLILIFSAVVFLGAVGWMFAGNLPERSLKADTPEQMLRAMTGLVEQGTPGRIVELVEAAPEGVEQDERELWEALKVRLGRVLDAAWALGEAMGEAFPEEIAELRSGRAQDGNSLGALVRGSVRGDVGDTIAGVLTNVLSDPFGALSDGAARVSFEELSDDEVAVLVDDEPVLPPLGLTARRGSDGRWRVVLPTSSPFLTRFMPSKRGEFAVFASILATAENILLELTADVERGQFESVRDVSDAAVRRAVLPLGMAFAALDRARRGDDEGADAP